LFKINNISELYEIGLSIINKTDKKRLGQYYTPKDVSVFMAKELKSHYESEKICDVSSGTGNLIIEFLSLFTKDELMNIINNRKIHLFDLDETAMFVAKMIIAYNFINNKNDFENIDNLIIEHTGNFLSDKIVLPDNSVVISNPPYGKLDENIEVWNECTTKKTNDLYGLFIEKMVKQSNFGVIISPQSYLGSNKFKSLRKSLKGYSGKIFAFDNVPASIFNGRKKGIFNSNTANSVRAAIMVYLKKDNGFRISPLVRFKNTERELVINNLNNILGNKLYQDSQPWLKVPKQLEKIVDILKDHKRISDYIENNNSNLIINVPSTPRYFITATNSNLSRSSIIKINPKNDYYNKVIYLMLNSSISYLWWRIHDGGITITKETLLSIPVIELPVEIVNNLYEVGINLESQNIIVKNNANKLNENIKFPKEYRDKINLEILNHLNLDSSLINHLNSIHFNNFKESLQYLI
jgi:predicted RNA methylase